MKRNLSLDTWTSLSTELFAVLGVDVSAARFAGNAKYTSHDARDDLLRALNEVVLRETKQLVKTANFLGITADESMDTSNLSHLDLHLQLAKNGQVVVRFGGIETLSSATADSIMTSLEEWSATSQVPLAKSHLGSDGAATFVGKRTGVATQLQAKHPFMQAVHCAAHREALCVSDAVKAVVYLKETVEPTLQGVFCLFKNSPLKESKLHPVQQLLEEPILKLKEPMAVRWLSHEGAVTVFRRTIASIVTAHLVPHEQALPAGRVGLFRAAASHQNSHTFSAAAGDCPR